MGCIAPGKVDYESTFDGLKLIGNNLIKINYRMN